VLVFTVEKLSKIVYIIFMKKLYPIMILLVFWGICVFGDTANQEEINFLLFLPNSGSYFADPAQASSHLDAVARYLKDKTILPGQIYVYGYTANAPNDIDPVSLSIRRARFVIQELQRRGISGDLFADPVGYGPVDLWGDNTNEADKHPNRRVRILLDKTVLTQAIVTAEPEKTAEPAAAVKPQEKPAEKARFSFHWQLPQWHLPWQWLLLLLLPLLAIAAIALASKRKKDTPAKPGKPKPVIVPKAEPPKVEPQKTEPQRVEPQKTEPVPVPVPVPEQKAAPIPFFAQKADPPKEKVIVLEEEEIRRYSYELFERRNGEHGFAEQDWYKSISELTAIYQAQGYRVILYWDTEADAFRQH
jgi:hypothetical protein